MFHPHSYNYNDNNYNYLVSMYQPQTLNWNTLFIFHMETLRERYYCSNCVDKETDTQRRELTYAIF